MSNNSSKNARVVRFTETGGPEVLKIVNVEVPAPSPHEVRVRVKAFSLNRADVMYRMGFYLETPVFPSGLGYEAAAVVEAIGSDVTGFEIGDAVNVIGAFSLNDYGTYGELILLPAYTLQKYPSLLSIEEAAATWTSFLSMYGMLIDSAKIQRGQSVVINAASSSAGLAAIQITNFSGGISIAVTSTSSKKEALLKAGAAHVIVSNEQDITGEILKITEGKGANIILDPVAGSTFSNLVAGIAERGQILIYGALSQELASFPVLDVLFKCPTIKGYTAMDVLENQAVLQAAIQFINDGINQGKLKPVIAKTFSFEQVVEATRYMESNQHLGKIVVTV